MDLNDATTVNISTSPTVKEQLIGYGLGLAYTAVSVAVVTGGFWLAGKVAEKLEERKLAKETSETSLFTEK